MRAILNIEEPIVSVDWLQKHLEAANLVILNATIPKVANAQDTKHENMQIPNALFFDIKKKFSDLNGEFPNTCPTEAQFTREAQALGICKDSAIVIYDDLGIYSSARAWWLFKTFGHTNVAVLNGGLPEWKRKALPLEYKKDQNETALGDFVGQFQKDYMYFYKDILAIQNDSKYTILDARSKTRFTGEKPEPREGLRSGTIPNSKNLPYEMLLKEGKLLSKQEIEDRFKMVTNAKTDLVFSCGSGITACVLALGADLIGYNQLAVYDGSWTEYGSLTTKEETMRWTKNELIAYTLLYAANSNFIEDNKERNLIIKRVDMQTFQKIHDEFDADNDYQSIQKISQGLKDHEYTPEDLDELFGEIKLLFFSDGTFDITERIVYRSLKKILS